MSKKNWVDQSEIRMKTCISELDVMIKEPENYEIYKLIFEIINPNQIRAISTDTRIVFHRNHLLSDPSTLNLIKPTLMGHRLLAFNPGNPI